MRILAVAALAFLLSGCFSFEVRWADGATPTVTPVDGLPACTWADVKHVTDGDTIVVTLDGREERVRYMGVDTPEVAGSPAGAEPFGAEASKFNRDLIGDQVCLEAGLTERDQYGRLLRYVWLADGRFVNEELVRAGLAEVHTYRPDVKYEQSRYLPAQDEARAAGRGIWSTGN